MSTNSKSKIDQFKELSFFALFSLIFGSMMGSGVFDIPQNIAHKAGVLAVMISWLITAVGMFSLAWAFVYISSKRPDIQSGIYGYAKDGFGSYIGFNSAWGYWLNATLGNASYLVYIFATLSNFALFQFFGEPGNIYTLLCQSLLIWFVYWIINRGIKQASMVNIFITSVKLVSLVAIIVLFWYGFEFSQFKANFIHDMKVDLALTDQIKSTMLVTIWSFLGIEAACIYALHSKSMKAVSSATMLGLILVLLIDAMISLLPFGILPTAEIQALTTPSTAGLLSTISDKLSGNVIRIAVIISVAGALLAWVMLATNICFVAADGDSLPKALKKINKRNVPQNALLVSSIALQLFIIGAFFTNSVYLVMIQFATSLILIPYLLAGLYALKLIISSKKIYAFELLKGFLAITYGGWLVYAGGLKYLTFSSCFYLFGVLIYRIARKEQGKPLFENKFEWAIFLLIAIVAVSSLGNVLIN